MMQARAVHLDALAEEAKLKSRQPGNGCWNKKCVASWCKVPESPEDFSATQGLGDVWFIAGNLRSRSSVRGNEVLRLCQLATGTRAACLRPPA